MSFEGGASCRDSVTTDFFTEAQETKTTVPFHYDGSFSSGVKTTSPFLEPFGRRQSNVADIVGNCQRNPMAEASVSAKWVEVKSHICLFPRRYGVWP